MLASIKVILSVWMHISHTNPNQHDRPLWQRLPEYLAIHRETESQAGVRIDAILADSNSILMLRKEPTNRQG